MAWKGYFFQTPSRAVYWTAVQAFMIGIGWTLHDNISATVKVYTSRGESGTEPPVYVWFDAGTSTYFQIKLYQFWSNTSHSGARQAGSILSASYQYLTFDVSKLSMMAGDKDWVTLGTNVGVGNSASSYFGFGHLQMRFDPNVTTASGTAGTAGTITVGSTAGLGVGKYVQIVEDGTAGCDTVLITEMVDATTIKVAKLPRNYGTAYLGAPASIGGVVGAGGSQTSDKWYPASSYYDAGTAGTSTYYNLAPQSGLSAAISAFSKKLTMSPYYIATDSATYGIMCGGIGRNLGYIYNQYAGSICLRNLDNSFPRSGTVSTALGGTVVDKACSWVVNEHAGRFVVIVGGTGIGSFRKIVSNTSDTLTLQSAWTVDPDGSSDYKIADELWYGVSYYFQSSNVFINITDTIIPS